MTPELYQRVKLLFIRALEIPEADRAAWLERECEGDLKLLGEVKSLLASQQKGALFTGSVVIRPSQAGHSASRHSTTSSSVMPLSYWVRIGFGGRRWVIFGVVVTIWIVIALSKLWLDTTLTSAMRQIRSHELQATLGMQATAVEELLKTEISRRESWVRLQVFRQKIEKLAEGPIDADRTADLRRLLPLYFRELSGSDQQFVFLSPTFEVLWDQAPNSTLAISIKKLVSQKAPELLKGLNGVLEGKPYLKVPTQQVAQVDLEAASSFTLCLPVFHSRQTDQVIGIMVFRSKEPAERLAALLSHGRMESTLETFAFNSEGLFLSESRFVDQLELMGRLPHSPRSTAVMRLSLRDPGGDMTSGYRPSLPVEQWPLTEMVQSAIQHQGGINLDGYRDYRGVKVVGAWTWLDQYNIGLAIKMDYAEAFAPMSWLHHYFTFRIAFSTTALLVILWMLLNLNLHWAQAEQAVAAPHIDSDQFGPYKVVKEIGSGGMGVIYLARHALLNRPTALKLLRPEQVSRHSLVLFEREVQLISSLNHPNIVQVYDYGMTPNGVFYYAMEYIDGLTLEELVGREKFVRPARVIFLLKQVCDALLTAHSKSLIHRDIKPQNIMICRRDGQADVVKLLDFGLVKELDPNNPNTLTGALAGTPRYMAPERFRSPESVDVRADIYAIGAVAYRLLTGENVPDLSATNAIQADSPDDMHPSRCAKQPIPLELDDLVFSCLAFDPERRPQSAEVLIERLNQIPISESWSDIKAHEWWAIYEASLPNDGHRTNAEVATASPASTDE